MLLETESNSPEDYLFETEEVDLSHYSIQEKALDLYSKSSDDVDFVKRSFEFVRDDISHSWDIQSSRITCKASDVLYYKEGICYAKTNLLAAILRSKGIPTGFCYQRLTLGDTPETGYCIHALNAVFLKSVGRWIRLDARGNKAGVHAEFSVTGEKLAFSVREEYNEMDYSKIFKHPNPKTIRVLKSSSDCINMYRYYLPSDL